MRETVEVVAPGVWVRKAWYDQTRVAAETWVKGPDGVDARTPSGPHRTYDLDGRLVREILTAEGKASLTVAEYERARARDPRLPPATVPAPAREMYEEFARSRATDPRYLAIAREDTDAFCEALLRDGAAVLLSDVMSRNLDGKSFIDVGQFVIELSEVPQERSATFRAVAPWLREQGYDVPDDIGQKYLYLRIK